MTRKVLMCSTVSSTIRSFNMDNIRLLREMGYEVHVACDFLEESRHMPGYVREFKEELGRMGVRHFQVGFSRDPMSLGRHVGAYRRMLEIFLENAYDFAHCHTPIASAICRVAAHRAGIPCIYTAHGFHFFRGAPLRNWVLYYPVEKALSRWTDVLITINREDYGRARRKLSAKRTLYVPGVGIDLGKFRPAPEDAARKRAELGVSDGEVMALSVGELSRRKDHEVAIRAIKESGNPRIRYFICGSGDLGAHLKELAKNLGVRRQVRFLGFRADVVEILRASDLFLFPSRQEGLPVALMEAIACQVPVMCTKIRGNTDLVRDFLFEPGDAGGLARMLRECARTREDVQRRMGGAARENYGRLRAYSLENVSGRMREIYQNFTQNDIRFAYSET